MAVVGTEFRVVCETCEIEQTVTSQNLAEDLVEAHEEDANCDGADWEAVEDD